MEPLSAAATLATLVSLLADFSSQRKDAKDADLDDFKQWLSKNRHDEIVTLIEQNNTTSISIKALLNQSSASILEKLEALDRSFAQLVSAIPEFKALADLAYPQDLLSEQAISMLQQFNDTQASSALEIPMMDGHHILFMDGAQGAMTIGEPRFLDDDINTLSRLGLLNLGRNARGERILRITRAAHSLLQRR